MSCLVRPARPLAADRAPGGNGVHGVCSLPLEAKHAAASRGATSHFTRDARDRSWTYLACLRRQLGRARSMSFAHTHQHCNRRALLPLRERVDNSQTMIRTHRQTVYGTYERSRREGCAENTSIRSSREVSRGIMCAILTSRECHSSDADLKRGGGAPNKRTTETAGVRARRPSHCNEGG